MSRLTDEEIRDIERLFENRNEGPGGGGFNAYIKVIKKVPDLIEEIRSLKEEKQELVEKLESDGETQEGSD